MFPTLFVARELDVLGGNNLTFVFVEPQLEATSLVVKKTKHQFLLMLDVFRGVGLMNDAIAHRL